MVSLDENLHYDLCGAFDLLPESKPAQGGGEVTGDQSAGPGSPLKAMGGRPDAAQQMDRGAQENPLCGPA